MTILLPWRQWPVVCLAVLLLPAALVAEERTERFDRDPGWDGRNHRATDPEPRAIVQDFGYSATAHAGAAAPGTPLEYRQIREEAAEIRKRAARLKSALALPAALWLIVRGERRTLAIAGLVAVNLGCLVLNLLHVSSFWFLWVSQAVLLLYAMSSFQWNRSRSRSLTLPHPAARVPV